MVCAEAQVAQTGKGTLLFMVFEVLAVATMGFGIDGVVVFNMAKHIEESEVVDAEDLLVPSTRNSKSHGGVRLQGSVF